MHERHPNQPHDDARTDPGGVVVNADRVTPYLYVGGAPGTGPQHDAAAECAALVALGVTDILDCRAEAGPEARTVAEAAGLRYANVPVEDGLPTVPDTWFTAGLEVARRALDEPGRVLLTHCQGGRGRGPSMGFAVLVDRGVPADAAFASIKRARPRAQITYAPDALDHHHTECGTDPATAAAERASLAREQSRWS